MQGERTFDTALKVHLYDGYQSEPIWHQDEKNSTYYDSVTDRQCRVPIPSDEQLRQELGL